MTATPALDPKTLGDGVGRAAMIGASIGFFVMGGVASSIGLFAGLEPRSSVGIGAFVGVWGGPGFGAMFGAIRAITRNERAARLTPGDLDPI